MKSMESLLADLQHKQIQLWLDDNKLRYKAPKDALTDELRAALSTHKQRIVQFLQEAQADVADPLPPLAPVTRTDHLPLSFAQARMWFLAQLEGSNRAYNIPLVVELRGKLDVRALQTSWQALVARHEGLRTCYRSGADALPYQVILPPPAVTIAVEPLPAQGEITVEQWLAARINAPFALDEGLPWRLALLQLRAEEHILLLVLHHITADGWSLDLIWREWSQLYAAVRQAEPVTLPVLPIQYADYAVWQRTWLQGDLLEEQLAFWRQHLAGAPSLLELPTDYPRPAMQRYAGAGLAVPIAPTLSAAVQALCARLGVTPFMLLIAAFQVLLHRYSGQDDIVVGTPIANRTQVETEGVVGVFVNTLALRGQLADNPTFRTFLAQVRTTTQAAYDHQALPFELLVDALHSERSLSHAPIFQAMFTLQNNRQSDLRLPGLTTRHLLPPIETTKFDLSLELMESEEGLRAWWEYNRDLFAPATIARMAGHYQTLLAGIVADPEQRISDLPLLTPAEREQLLVEWNATAAAYPHDQGVHELFAAQAARTPDALAVVMAQGPVEPALSSLGLTYAELNGRANQLAHQLRALGVGPEVLVGICVERSLEMVVGLLGILKAGGAYVPLDPTYPADRLAFMVQDAEIAVLVTQSQLLAQLPPTQALVLCLDRDWPQIAQAPTTPPAATVDSAALAYVIYTSGSTGRPKGVQIPHQALTNFLWTMKARPGLTAADRLLSVTTLSFDIAALELYLPLIVGGTVVLADQATVRDGTALAACLTAHAVTVMQATPATWQLLMESGWPGKADLKILCGGEALSPTLRAALQSRCHELWNVYGPTETTVWSTVHQIKPSDDRVLIGRPIANTQIYIVDAARNPVPVGIVGHLYIGGSGVAKGYLHRADLTQERFIDHPWGSGKLYHTGDLARYLPDGTIECLGRSDYQVKIRGFRIELHEIEAMIMQHGEVKEAVVVAQEAANAQKQLAAYIVPQAGAARQPLQFSLFYFASARGGDAAGDNYRLYREGAKFADTHDFTAIWTPERHFHEIGGQYPNPALLSAALAMVTERLHLRAGSVVAPIQNPLRVAEEWAVVDNLSGGRVGVAFASGWHPVDFAFYPENFAQRKSLMIEQIQQIQALWQGEAIPVRDGLGNATQVKVFPRPVQATLPCWITAAGNPATFEQAGRSGANLLTHLLGQSLDEAAEKIAIYRQARAAAGYDPATGQVTMMIHTFVWPDQAEAVALAREPFCQYLRSHIDLLRTEQAWEQQIERASAADLDALVEAAFLRYLNTASLIGTPDNCLATMQRLQAMGVNEVACLIDFGIEESTVIAGLTYLDQLRQISQQLSALSVAELHQFLQQRLPEYMLPTHYQLLPTLPRTPNGKLDRKALPVIVADYKQLTGYDFVPPTTPVEQQLAAIWAEVLGSGAIGTQHNFFAIGGHSLLATKVVARIRQAFALDLALHTFFQMPTIKQLAQQLENMQILQSLQQAPAAFEPLHQEIEL